MPFISFVVPVYNLKKFLPTCVESVALQPFHDWEIILVDDNSSDGSELLCDQYAMQDTRVKVVHLSSNVGPGVARNEGVINATGDYVFFLDGDDAIVAGELPRLFEFIAKSNLPDMIHVLHSESFGCITTKNAIHNPTTDGGVYSVDDFLRPSLGEYRVGFQVWQFVIKRAMLLNSGIAFHAARICEDNDFILRTISFASSIGKYTRVFYHWRTRLSGSLTSAHASGWKHIVASAASMLEFVCSNTLPELVKKWALRNVHSIILQFEDVAGAVTPTDLKQHINLFLPFENHIQNMCEYIFLNGLLWHIHTLGTQKGVLIFCQCKTEETRALLNEKTNRDIYGFPATRRCSRLLDVLAANGYHFKGLLDNATEKQGLIMDGLPILSPEIIPSCYDDNNKVFVVISTYRRETGTALANQLRSYGMEEGKDFICSEYESD